MNLNEIRKYRIDNVITGLIAVMLLGVVIGFSVTTELLIASRSEFLKFASDGIEMSQMGIMAVSLFGTTGAIALAGNGKRS